MLSRMSVLCSLIGTCSFGSNFRVILKECFAPNKFDTV